MDPYSRDIKSRRDSGHICAISQHSLQEAKCETITICIINYLFPQVRCLPLLAVFLVVTALATGSIEVSPMGYYAIRVDPETGQITPMELHQEPLPAAAQEALQRVPEWIRPLLERQFRLLMQDYMVLGGNSRPAVGDINGDGLPDLVVGEGDGTLHVYINVGNAIEPLFKEMEVISLGGLIGGGS